MHRHAARHDDRFASRTTDDPALGGFQACLSDKRVPGLWAWMPMDERGHAWGEDRLHILRRVLGSRTYGKRTDFRNLRATGGAPSGYLDRTQLYYPYIHDHRCPR